MKKLSNLSVNAQAVLCERIGNVKRQGVLGDWGYAVLMTERSTATCSDATSPDAADPPAPSLVPSQVADKCINCVPVIPVFSNNAQPTLISVPELTKNHDIILAMGPLANVESDLRHTIDTSPLYRTVRSIFLVREIIQQINY